MWSLNQRVFNESIQAVEHPVGRLKGHALTILPYVADRLSPVRLMRGRTYLNSCIDDVRGSVPIIGTLFTGDVPTRRLVILQHGIASSRREPYILRTAKHLVARGFDALSISLRGSHGVGTDHYHAGLTDDLKAVFEDPALSEYTNIWVIGYSLGGQIAMRFALDVAPDRLAGVVTVCAPLCMRSAQIALDARRRVIYRRPILATLKQRYRTLWRNGVSEGHQLVGDLDRILKAKTFFEWDETVVCPRFGFESVRQYYEHVSTRDQLDQLTTPAFALFARHDPIVPYASISHLTTDAPSLLTTQVLDHAGHLGCVRQLGLAGLLGDFEGHILQWIDKQVGEARGSG